MFTSSRHSCIDLKQIQYLASIMHIAPHFQLLPLPPEPQSASGSGTQTSPALITSPHELCCVILGYPASSHEAYTTTAARETCARNAKSSAKSARRCHSNTHCPAGPPLPRASGRRRCSCAQDPNSRQTETARWPLSENQIHGPIADAETQSGCTSQLFLFVAEQWLNTWNLLQRASRIEDQH